jgi:hypothetical protein
MNQPTTQPEPKTDKSKFLDPKSNLKSLVRVFAIILILGVGIWLLLRFTVGEKAANRVAATVLQRPIELKNSVENVPATSFKGVALSLPYTGTLTVEATVVKGNDLDIYLVEDNQIENVKAQKSFTHLNSFEATKTKNFRRSARLKSGTYCLILMDKTLGILSAKSSDVQIQAKLEP